MVLHLFLVSFLIFKCQLICTYSAVHPAVFAYAFAGSAMMSVLCAFLFNPSISTAHLARKWAGPFNPGFPAFLVCLFSCASFHSQFVFAFCRVFRNCKSKVFINYLIQYLLFLYYCFYSINSPFRVPTHAFNGKHFKISSRCCCILQ